RVAILVHARHLFDRRLLRSPLFPYTTLFRSRGWRRFRHSPRAVSGRRAPSGAPATRLGVSRRCCAGYRAPGEARTPRRLGRTGRSEEHTSELQSLAYLVCRLLLEKKKKQRSA